VRPTQDGRFGKITLGHGVYLGRDAELATAQGGDLIVGADTSVQDRCVFHGDIIIGSHCLFGPNVMMSTTIHRFRDHPSWLIRDQDAAMNATPAKPDDYSRPIRIEDDCWIGWGAAIMPGVTVGRGAVIGANCVVTRDVGPYEIHGGAPNRLLGQRMPFQPPTALSANCNGNMAYFYRGFRLRQREIAQSREQGTGLAANGENAVIVLAGRNDAAVRLEGFVHDTAMPLRLKLALNGTPVGEYRLAAGPFELAIQAAAKSMPGPLACYTVLEMTDLDHRAANPGGTDRYSILSAKFVLP
jgi:acetyltransferase-like isoleucine patch superfamily enzyme